MASLSKRQRRETLSIVERAIAPEWKVLTYRGTGGAYTQSSDGPGQDIFAPITQGVGESNRIGNEIRIRRVQFWVRLVSPIIPLFKGSIPSAVCVYRKESAASANPAGGFGDFFDTSVVGGGSSGAEKYFMSTPRKRDLEDRGLHIIKIMRHRLFGSPIICSRIGDLEHNQLVVPYDVGNGGTQAGTLTEVTSGNQSLYSGNPGGHSFYNVLHPVEGKEVGKYEVYKTWHHVYGGGGLKVGFADATLAVLDTNHQFIMFSSAVSNGAVADAKPSYEVAWRIWFTDN